MSELPRITIGKKSYYLDRRLKEVRNVRNPHERMSLAEAEQEILGWLHRLRFQLDNTQDMIIEEERSLKVLRLD